LRYQFGALSQKLVRGNIIGRQPTTRKLRNFSAEGYPQRRP